MSQPLICTLILTLIIRERSCISSELETYLNTEENPENYLQTSNLESVFSDVYSKCFLTLSYTCIQRRTLLYLKGLNQMQEIPLIGDFIKLVQIKKPSSSLGADPGDFEKLSESSSPHLTQLIDEQVENFFKNHALQLGREKLALSNERDEARKKKKGGGGGGSGHGDGKMKKMMMMAVMCMKMKMMMVMPAMMGMMGMMSFKGMMFGMMSFMIAKMMLLMKLLQSKGGPGGGGGDPWAGGGGGGGGGAGSGGWAAGKMAMIHSLMSGGGQADNYGGSGGGYNAAGEWQSRNIAALGEASNQSSQNRKKRASTLGPNILQQLRQYSDFTPSSMHRFIPTSKMSTVYKSEKESTENANEILSRNYLNGPPTTVQIIDWTPDNHLVTHKYNNVVSADQNTAQVEKTTKSEKGILEYEDIYKNNNIPEQLKYNPNSAEFYKRNCSLSKILLKEFLDQLKSKSQSNFTRTPRKNASPSYGQMKDSILNSTKKSYESASDYQTYSPSEDVPKPKEKAKLTIEDNKFYPQIRFKRHLSYLWQDEPNLMVKNKKHPKKKSEFQKIMETVEENPWI